MTSVNENNCLGTAIGVDEGELSVCTIIEEVQYIMVTVIIGTHLFLQGDGTWSTYGLETRTLTSIIYCMTQHNANLARTRKTVVGAADHREID